MVDQTCRKEDKDEELGNPLGLRAKEPSVH